MKLNSVSLKVPANFKVLKLNHSKSRFVLKLNCSNEFPPTFSKFRSQIELEIGTGNLPLKSRLFSSQANHSFCERFSCFVNYSVLRIVFCFKRNNLDFRPLPLSIMIFPLIWGVLLTSGQFMVSIHSAPTASDTPPSQPPSASQNRSYYNPLSWIPEIPSIQLGSEEELAGGNEYLGATNDPDVTTEGNKKIILYAGIGCGVVAAIFLICIIVCCCCGGGGGKGGGSVSGRSSKKSLKSKKSKKK